MGRTFGFEGNERVENPDTEMFPGLFVASDSKLNFVFPIRRRAELPDSTSYF